MHTILHINDNNLLVQTETVLSAGQGYAWLNGDEVVFDTGEGLRPVSHCRLAPHEINHRYWQQCDQSAIAANQAGMRHSGDLIWRHLGQLRDTFELTSLVLAVSSHYREADLQLLLGIAQSCRLEVSGVVNKAILAASSRVSDEGHYLHIDLQLHQAVLSTLQCKNGQVSLVEFDTLQDIGIHSIQETLLRGLQSSFIQNDRFDPLHYASTEQQLFDQLPAIAKQIDDSGKANIAVQHRSRTHSISIDAKDWHALLNPFFNRFLDYSKQPNFAAVLVDLNALFDHVIPAQLAASNVIVVDAVESEIDALFEMAGNDAVHYITKLPCTSSQQPSSGDPTLVESANTSSSLPDSEIAEPATMAATNRDAVSSLCATHVLCAGIATPIEQAHIASQSNTLTVSKGDPNIARLLAQGQIFILNDESRQELQLHDRLGSQLADGVLTMIRVL